MYMEKYDVQHSSLLLSTLKVLIYVSTLNTVTVLLSKNLYTKCKVHIHKSLVKTFLVKSLYICFYYEDLIHKSFFRNWHQL